MHGKHEKTGKARENTSEKVTFWNTIEQYAGLKSVAASHFSDIIFNNIRKAENRYFLESEQYAGLESEQARILPVQAARSRGPGHLWWPGSRGTQGAPGAEKP